MPLDLGALRDTAMSAGGGSNALLASQDRLAAARKRSGTQMAELLAMLAASGGRGVSLPTGGGGGAPINGRVSGNVDTWITAAMRATGLNEKYRGILRTLVQHESGGNPSAVNRWDINAKRGTPSQGLAQTIPGTFSAYRLRGFQGASPGEGQIMDPEENLVAAIRYALSRYKSLDNLPGVRSMRAGGGWKGY
jgi:Transglycosylase SLT domain